MDWIDFLRWAHILGACVLIGTGAGIAFFMFMANRTGDPKFIAQTAGVVVLADWIFTASAVVIQPITGVLLATAIGWPLDSPWILLSIFLYLVIGCLWLPVVRIQLKLKHIAEAAVTTRQDLPPVYHKLFRRWFWCGVPAFTTILMLLWLMVAKPAWQ